MIPVSGRTKTRLTPYPIVTFIKSQMTPVIIKKKYCGVGIFPAKSVPQPYGNPP
jgi:hypothetical protein